MPKPLDLRSAPPLTNWHRLRRFFHLEGNLGGLRYEARFGIFELKAPDTFTVGNEIVAAPQGELLTDSSTNERSIAPDPQVSESEGGTSIDTNR